MCRRGGGRYLHRIMYEAYTGKPIPPGMVTDHLCLDRACCNPTHIEIVTRRVNGQRQHRVSPLVCKNGHWFTKETTYIHRGRRRCRKCRAEAERRYLQRRRG